MHDLFFVKVTLYQKTKTFHLLSCKHAHTELCNPGRYSAVDLIQHQNHQQVDDDSGGCHGYTHISLGLVIRVHWHNSKHNDAVENHSRHGRERDPNLRKQINVNFNCKNNATNAVMWKGTYHKEDRGYVDAVSWQPVCPWQRLRGKLQEQQDVT